VAVTKGIIRMVEHDFRNFFRYKWWLVGLISMNLADLFIMAVVYSKMFVCLSFHDWKGGKHGTPKRDTPVHAEFAHD
jgi:hypothetical protein